MRNYLRTWRRWLISDVGLLFLFALSIRLYGIAWGLPNIVSADETFIVMKSLSTGAGNLNAHFFNWPANIMLYLVGFLYGLYFLFGYFLGWFSTPTTFALTFFDNPTGLYLIARVFVALLSAATVVVVYQLAASLYTKRAGILAGLFLAVSYAHIASSRYATPDNIMVFFFMLSLLYSWKIATEGKCSHYLLAGIFLGLSVATKYNGVFAFLGILLGHLYRNFFGKKVWSWKFLFQKELLLAGGISLVAFFIVTPFALHDFPTFLEDVQYMARINQGTGEKVGTAFVFIPGLQDAFGTVLFVAILASLLFSLYRPDRKYWFLMLIAIAYFLFVSRNVRLFLRYLIPLLPLLSIPAAGRIDRLLSSLTSYGKRQWRWSKPKQQMLTTCFIILLLLHPFLFNVRYAHFILQPHTNLLAKEWIEEHIPSGSNIALDLYSVPLVESKESLLNKFIRTRVRSPEEASLLRQFYERKHYPEPAYNLFPLLEELDTKGYRRIGSIQTGEDPFGYYTRNAISYVITNSDPMPEEIFGYNTTRSTNPPPSKVALYSTLEREHEKLFDLEPIPWKRPGHHIRVYRIIPKIPKQG